MPNFSRKKLKASTLVSDPACNIPRLTLVPSFRKSKFESGGTTAKPAKYHFKTPKKALDLMITEPQTHDFLIKVTNFNFNDVISIVSTYVILHDHKKSPNFLCWTLHTSAPKLFLSPKLVEVALLRCDQLIFGYIECEQLLGDLRTMLSRWKPSNIVLSLSEPLLTNLSLYIKYKIRSGSLRRFIILIFKLILLQVLKSIAIDEWLKTVLRGNQIAASCRETAIYCSWAAQVSASAGLSRSDPAQKWALWT